MDPLEERFLKFVEENALFTREEKLLVGISGGPDSVCLAYLLFNLGFHFDLAHVNYHLRGKESDEDTQFCQSLADRFQCRIHVLHAFLEKTNVQEMARKIRYQWFFHLKAQHGYDKLLTAHHLDDQIESMLYYFTRGAHYHLFHPIPVKTDRGVTRPLSFATKQEILNYLHLHNIPYRRDASNLTDAYLRNRIRNEWIPLLGTINPNYQRHFQHQFELYNEQLHLVKVFLSPHQKRWIEKRPDQSLVIHLPSSTESFVLWKHVLYDYFASLYSTYDLQALFSLYSATVGKRIEMKYHLFIRERDSILGILKANQQQNPAVAPFELQNPSFPCHFEWSGLRFRVDLLPASSVSSFRTSSSDSCYMDWEQIDTFLRWRLWREGDRMRNPLGLKGSKLVSDILNELKVPAVQKPFTWVLEDASGILYVQGYRIAERVKITSQTLQVLKIHWAPLSSPE